MPRRTVWLMKRRVDAHHAAHARWRRAYGDNLFVIPDLSCREHRKANRSSAILLAIERAIRGRVQSTWRR